jgi:hypothetical protein
MNLRKAVKVSKGDFKPQHCDWAKCTVGKFGTIERLFRDGEKTVRGGIVSGM